MNTNIKTFTTGYNFATTTFALNMDIIDTWVLKANTNILQELFTYYNALDGDDIDNTNDIDTLVQSLEPELLLKHISVNNDPSGTSILVLHWEVQDPDFANDEFINIDEDYTPTIAAFMTKFNDMHSNEGTYNTMLIKGTNTFITTYTL